MKLSELVKEILSEWEYRVDNGLPDPKNPQHIRELANVLDEMGLSEIKNEWIINITEGDQFKNPALNKVITYKDVNGEDAEGMVGNLIRRPKEEDAHQKAVASLGGEGSDTYKKAMNDLGGEGQPNRDIEKEKEKKGEGGPKGEKPQPVTAFDPNSEGGAEYLGELPDTDPAKPDSMKTDTSEVKQAKEVVKGLEGRTSVDGDELDAETTENGSILIGVEHGEGTQSTKKTIEQMKSLPKDAKVMFVGEGGVGKDDSGKIDFVGEQAEIRDAFLDHFENGVEESWDENGDVRNSDAPIFDEIAKSFGGDKNKALASVWTNMVGQGDDLAAEDYLTDETKAWIVGEAKKGGSKNFEGDVDWDNLSDEQKEDLYQLNFRDDANYDETELSKGQEAFNDYRQKELDRKIKEGEEQGYTVIATMGNSHVDLWRNRKSKEKADAEAKGGLDYLKGLSDTDPGKPDSMKNDTEKTQSDGGVVYSVGGGYYADSPGGAPKYRKATKEGIDTLDFRYILESEGEVVKKVAGGKGETVSMVVVGDDEKKNAENAVEADKFDNLTSAQKAKVVAEKIAKDDASFGDVENKEAHSASLIQTRSGEVNNGQMLPPGNPGSSFAENNGAAYIKDVFSKGGELSNEEEEVFLDEMMKTPLAQQIPEKDRKRWAKIALETAKTEARVLLNEPKYNAKNPQPEGFPSGAIMDKQNRASVERLINHKLEEARANGDTKGVQHYEKQLKFLNKLKETDTGVLYVTNDGNVGFKHTSNKSSYKDPHNNTSPSQVMKGMREEMGDKLDPEVENAFTKAEENLSDSNAHIKDDVDKFNKSRENKTEQVIREENEIYGKALTNFPVAGGGTKDYLRGEDGVVGKPWFKKYASEKGLTQPFDDNDVMNAVFENAASDNPDSSTQKIVLKLSEMVEKSTPTNMQSMAKKFGLSVEEYQKTLDTVGVGLKSTAGIRRDVMGVVHENLIDSMQKADSKNPDDYPSNPEGDNGPHQQAYVGGFMKRMHFDSYIMGDRDGVASQNIEGDNVDSEHYRSCLGELSGFKGDTTTSEGRSALVKHLEKRVRISAKSGSIVFVSNEGKEVELGVDQYRTKGDGKAVLGSLGKDLQTCLKSKAKKK